MWVSEKITSQKPEEAFENKSKECILHQEQLLIQHKLNHSSWAITKAYIGITDDDLKANVYGYGLVI